VFGKVALRFLLSGSFCEAEQTLFASFSGKRRTPSTRMIRLLGARPQTPWVGFAEVRVKTLRFKEGPSAKQNKRFLLLFLEKEEYH
jgi:hypothetical protein